MKRSIRSLLVAAALVAFFALSASAAFASTLTYADEFNTSFDSATWAKLTPWSTKYTTGELEYYDPADTVVNNGMLTITSEKRAMNGYNYTSGIITSLNRPKFQYGYFEMRAKLPKGQGIWPAFWLTNDSTSEIDIFEMLGNQPNKLYFTLHHTHDGTVKSHHQSTLLGPDYSLDFHTYAVDWQPGYIKWYVDGVEVWSYTDNIPSDPMWIVANTAVGGAWPGSPDATTVFPQTYSIDYIRVYDTRPTTTVPPTTTVATESAPVASPESYAATANTTLTVPAAGVLSNDKDANADSLTATMSTPPSHGSVTLGADGAVTYVPAAGFAGTDTFTYCASDGKLSSAATTVTINVKSDVRVRKIRKNTFTIAGTLAAAPTAETVIVQSQHLYHHRWHTYKVLARTSTQARRYSLRIRKPSGVYRVRVIYGSGSTASTTRWVRL